MTFSHMLLYCFHLILGLKAGRHPGCWAGLSPALSCGVSLASQVCTAPRASPAMGYLHRHREVMVITLQHISVSRFQVRSQIQLLLAGRPSSLSGFQLSYRQWWWAHHLELFPFLGPLQCCCGVCPDLQWVPLGEIRTLSQASLSTLWVPKMSGLQWVRARF